MSMCVRGHRATVCFAMAHPLGRRSVVRGAFGGSQAGIKGYGLSHMWNACRMAARMSCGGVVECECTTTPSTNWLVAVCDRCVFVILYVCEGVKGG